MELVCLASFLVAASIVLLFWGLSRSIRQSEEIIEGRLGRYGAGVQGPSAEGDGAAPDNSGGAGPSTRRRLEERGFAGRLARELAGANLTMTVSEFLLLSFGGGVLAAIIGIIALRSPIGIVAGPLGVYLPRVYLKRRRAARLRAFDDQLADTLTMIASSLRSGYSLVQAMDLVAREGAPPINEEFGRVVREIGLGLSVDTALANMLRRVPSDDLDLIITAMDVQHEVGGNLAQILDTITHTIRERVRIKGEIKVLTAYGRFGGYVIAALPLVMAGILFMINRKYLEPLYSTSCGLTMMGVAFVSMLVGFLLIRKIIDIPV